jgi:hypothetical protein
VNINKLNFSLGVLCDLAIKDGVNVKVKRIRNTNENLTHYTFDDDSGLLPPKVKVWAGIKDYTFTKTLVDMNDTEEMNFSQIASIIRLYMTIEQNMKETAKLDLLQKLNSL